MPDTVIRTRVNKATKAEILKIAARERRLNLDVVRLLIAAGLRQYRKRNSLMCGYEGCTRKDCCGGEMGKLAFFPHIVKPEEREERVVVQPEPPRYTPLPALRGLEHVHRILTRVGAEGAAAFVAAHMENLKLASELLGPACAAKIGLAQQGRPLPLMSDSGVNAG